MKTLRFVAVLAVAGALLFATSSVGVGAEEKPARGKALMRRGARLWSPYCGTCYNARPPGERSPAEWDTILLHMRVRENLPAGDAEALLAFLKSG
jgi:hypothetical protein